MITLTLDWREVLWWMQGGMSGSHVRWGVYEDMINKVWPLCDEQERHNLWYIMRRDLGDSWRPHGWSGYEQDPHGEGPWRDDTDIFDPVPWMHFRQVLARFDPENQWAVTMHVHNADELDDALCFLPAVSIIKQPNLSHFKRKEKWQSDTATVTIRAYKWLLDGEESYFVSWSRRCDPTRIAKVENLLLPVSGEII